MLQCVMRKLHLFVVTAKRDYFHYWAARPKKTKKSFDGSADEYIPVVGGQTKVSLWSDFQTQLEERDTRNRERLKNGGLTAEFIETRASRRVKHFRCLFVVLR